MWRLLSRSITLLFSSEDFLFKSQIWEYFCILISFSFSHFYRLLLYQAVVPSSDNNSSTGSLTKQGSGGGSRMTNQIRWLANQCVNMVNEKHPTPQLVMTSHATLEFAGRWKYIVHSKWGCASAKQDSEQWNGVVGGSLLEWEGL